jgi:murein hydrolase activator
MSDSSWPIVGLENQFMIYRVALLSLCCLALAVPLRAQQPTLQGEKSRLQQLQAEQQAARDRARALAAEAAKLEADISSSTRSMVDLASAIQAREDKLYGLENQLKLLEAEQSRQISKLNSRRADVGRLLGALQNLSRKPPQLLLVRPGAAIDTARSASLLTAVLPELRAQTDALKAEVAVVLDFRAKLETERAAYGGELDAMRGDRGKMDALRASREQDRARLLSESQAADARAKELAAEARDIKELLAKLEVEERKRQRLAALPGPRPKPDFTARPAVAQNTLPRTPTVAPPAPRTQVAINQPAVRPAGKPITTALGALALPVRGEIITQFGAAGPSGAARGISIKARADAQVVAPYAGRVVFAGPFRSMGRTLIISHGEGYYSVLAGFTRIDARKDQLVTSGEPVGVMGPEEAPEGSTLYVEIRKGEQPVNPLPWLSAGLRRTQG